MKNIDLQTTNALFKQHKMIFDLKKGHFDIGIGGLNRADSLFFTDMNIPYIKLSPGDIESHTMQNLLGMPVLLSSYPSIRVWSKYDYGTLPASFDSFEYRAQGYAAYAMDLWENHQDKKAYKGAVGRMKHRLVDEFDQD